jgi:Ser/Thr protein kinase RdoA (MazF antagonist)
MDDDRSFAHVVHNGSLVVVPGVIRTREAVSWLVDWQGARGVLRRRPALADTSAREELTADVAWLHSFLDRLADLGFPSPRPFPSFGGRSWTIADGLLWEIVSFIPGCKAGSDDEPSMEEIGGLLARYHAAARRIEVTGQRPGAIPLAGVPDILLSDQLSLACPDPVRAADIRQLAERLACDLETCGRPETARIIIHGDFTNHNVIADGIPPRPTGVIDFQLAHVEVPLADIGYGLWRSGRPRQEADCLDLARLQRFVRGYATTAPLSPGDASTIPVYLYGRGLQMIAKRVRAGRAETGMLAQVQWIGANAMAIADAAVAALP